MKYYKLNLAYTDVLGCNVPLDSTKLVAIRTWLKPHVVEWLAEHKMNPRLRYTHLYFKKEEDAILFKLTWL
jgi:hypothetical protein